MMNSLQSIYLMLLKKYGHQGWWPLLEVKGTNPTKTGSIKGYHPGDYSYPKTQHQKFEICLGAILTQNTAWPNVEKALANLDRLDAISPRFIIDMDETALKNAIRPAGYFNQKTKKLKIFAEFYLSLKTIPKREQLLDLWGIGPETADSILLYAYKVPVFVIDAYTKRIFPQYIDWPYEKIQQMFHKNLENDYILFQEYHALIVEHAKHLRGPTANKDSA